MTENSIHCSTLTSPNSHNNTIQIDATSCRGESLDEQIKCYRESNHAAFKSHKFGDINNINNHTITQSNNSNICPPHTILIASDSMLQNVDETRLRKNKYNVKVRAFRGSVILDMYDYLAPLLHKKPEYVIPHVSTNDCINLSSEKVMQDLLNLKKYIESIPGITVIISEPIMRCDNHALACLRVQHLKEKLRLSNVKLINNSNIVRKHIGRGGLHLNDYGTAKIAMNIISLIKRL